MSWDQEITQQDIQSFLLDYLEVNVEELLQKAILSKLTERSLNYSVSSDEKRIIFSDGRVFVPALTSIIRGDSWGSDYYTFVETGKPFFVKSTTYCGCDDDPHDSMKEMPGIEEKK